MSENKTRTDGGPAFPRPFSEDTYLEDTEKRVDEKAKREHEWVGLTDEEIDYQAKKDDHAVYFALGALWAEAKLKEKNT